MISTAAVVIGSGCAGLNAVLEIIRDDRRPIYETQYVTADEQLWTIYEINGAVMAYPASYNAESGRDVPLMLSETGRVMSYDGDTGTYFETVPNPDEMRVEQVARIDARTLEQWTKEALDRL